MSKTKVIANNFPITTGGMRHQRRRGNPGQHPINRLRTMVWCEAIMISLGLSDPRELESRVNPEKSKNFLASSKINDNFAGYITGEHVPYDKPNGIIDLSSDVAPGADRWFRSPFWTALKGEIFDPEIVYALLQRPHLQAILFSEGEPLEFDFKAHKGHPRLKGSAPIVIFELNQIQNCLNLDGLDLLEAIVLLLEYGYLSRNAAITSRALELYRAASPKICEIAEIRYTFEHYFEAVENRYASFINVPPDEIFPPWHVRMPDLTQRIFDIGALRVAAQNTTDEQDGSVIGIV